VSTVSSKRKWGSGTIDCAAGEAADPTSPSISQWHSYLSLARPQCKPVTFQPSERPFDLQLCIYFYHDTRET
jgi:hypothetical protein